MDNWLLILFSALLPAIVLVGYVYLLDKNQREPLPWMLKAVGYGVLCAVPAVFIESLLPSAEETTVSAALYRGFIVAAVSEESMKLLFLWLFLRKNPYFDERMDCIVYAVCVGMGFAALENVAYLFSAQESWGTVAVARATMAVPGHFFFAVFMGYFMSLAIWGKPEKRRLNWVLTLLVPIILHGIYDASLMSMPVSVPVLALALLIFVALGVYVWVDGHRRILRARARDKRRMPRRNPLKTGNSVMAKANGKRPPQAKTSPEIDKEKRLAIAELLDILVARPHPSEYGNSFK
ncbi:MAG: PrsW family intramembrane metalloprotease [Bacteroidaceae bacterium]|nr:PrsW family intramembrane metalloprotease [Bacteroidaceae bacterium]